MQVCPSCGAESPDRFRLCGYCGTELQPDSRPEIRRHVTILFSDLKGSTTLGESLDSEALFEVLSRYFDAMRAELEGHGGKIEKLIGDAIVAVFGLPVAHDDDPLRAVRAAAACQAALARLDDDLERAYGVRLVNRTGLATGEVTVGLPGPGEHVLTGAVVREAMRLEAAAPAMGVLMGAPTYEAARHAAETRPVVLGAGSGGHATAEGGGDGDGKLRAFELLQLVDADASAGALAGPSGELSAAPDDTVHCPNCGEADPASFRVCGTCGTSLGDDAASHESRKTVTIVFCDLRPAAGGGEALAPDILRQTVSRGFAVARAAVEHHGGQAEKFIGDALVAVFGLPVLHEDDALRATRAALSVQQAVTGLAEELRGEGIHLTARIGVNTGLVVAGDATPGLHLVTGDAVNTAARLEQAAPDGGILLGDSTYALVRDAVRVEAVEPLALKGKAEPVVAHRLVEVSGQEGRSRRHDTPMIGREADLQALRHVFTESVVQNGPRLVTVVGDSGIGKSRLVREFEWWLGSDALVLRGRCLAYGEGITFWPIIEILRSAAAIQDDDGPERAREKLSALVGDQGVADRLAALAGLTDAPFPLPDLFWAVRRFLEILAARRPLVAVIDGLQWAEPTLADLLQHVISSAAEAPILLVCLARDEFLESHPDWGAGGRARRLALHPLSPDDAARIVDHHLGRDHQAGALRGRIVEAGHGNPLFVEQIVSLLIDRGALRLDGARWVAAGGDVEVAVPPTIQALLAARIDRLPRDERDVIEPAAVVGYEFGRPAVEALVAEPVRAGVGERLDALEARQLVRADAAAAAEQTYRFKNLLVRDAAYEGLLKRSRVALHERYVAWADGVNRERGREREFEELLGYHLEQAYRYRTEFGPPDDEATAVGRDGARRLASAGRRAFERGDSHAAASLLRRSTALLEPGDPARLGLMPELGEALLELGEFDAADHLLGETIDRARAASHDLLAARATVTRLLVRAYTGRRSTGDPDLNAAIDLFTASGDHLGLAHAWRVRMFAAAIAGHYGELAAASQHVIEHARACGQRRLETRAMTMYVQGALLGPTPVPEAIELCEDFLQRVVDDRRTQALILCFLAQLYAMRLDIERARAAVAQARHTLDEMGRSAAAASVSLNSWRVEMLAGDPAGAERELRRDQGTLEAMGEHYLLSTVTGALAEVLHAQGRDEEAERFARRSEELTADDDVESQALWRGAMAQIAAARGDGDLSRALALEAIRQVEASEASSVRAGALLDAARAFAHLGEAEEARRLGLQAETLSQAKGDVAFAAVARTFLSELTYVPEPRAGAELDAR